jgi:uncharacterized protein YrrD
MRLGKELIGKPIYSMTDGRQLGNVKDIYLDLEISQLNGIFLGHEGLFNRKARVIARENIAVFGHDAVLVTDSDVETDSNDTPEVELWMRRENFQGRGIETPGGTKVGTVGDILFNEKAKVVGFSLARVFVTGPVADKRVVMKDAVADAGGKEGIVTVDLAKVEKADEELTELPEIVDDLQTPDPTGSTGQPRDDA